MDFLLQDICGRRQQAQVSGCGFFSFPFFFIFKGDVWFIRWLEPGVFISKRQVWLLSGQLLPLMTLLHRRGSMEVAMTSQGDHAACEVQAGALWEMCPQGCSTSMVVLGGYHLLGTRARSEALQPGAWNLKLSVFITSGTLWQPKQIVHFWRVWGIFPCKMGGRS